MDFDSVVQHLSQFMGANLTRCENCILLGMVDGTDIHMEYIESRDEFYMYGCVAVMTEERFRRHACHLMKANLFGGETGGSAVLAYDSDESRVVMWDKFRMSDLCLDDFRERFSCLYLGILHWSGRMRQDLSETDCDDSRSQAPIYYG